MNRQRRRRREKGRGDIGWIGGWVDGWFRLQNLKSTIQWKHLDGKLSRWNDLRGNLQLELFQVNHKKIEGRNGVSVSQRNLYNSRNCGELQ